MKHPSLLSLILTASTPLLAQPRGASSGAIVPILDVKSGFLLGGSRSGKWVPAKAAAPAMKNGANLRVFSATQSLGSARASQPKSEDAPCPDTLFSRISPESFAKKAEFALGGTHNPFPRAVQRQRTDQPIYRNLVAGILKSHGIAKPIVQIQQIWRVDLDGDGTQEVLISAARKDDEGDSDRIGAASRAGDYSLLLVRKIVGGKVRNIFIESAFYPRAKTFNAPSFAQIGSVLDADGDGKMEILIRGRYYEGESTSLYSVEGATAREVLSEGCGA